MWKPDTDCREKRNKIARSSEKTLNFPVNCITLKIEKEKYVCARRGIPSYGAGREVEYESSFHRQYLSCI